MKDDVKIFLIIFSSFLAQFSLNILGVTRLYPDFPLIVLWFLLIYFPEKWYWILFNLFLLELFSLPPVPGYYFLVFLFMTSFLYAGKVFFYVESLLFWVFFLSVSILLEWLLLHYISLIQGTSFEAGFFFFTGYFIV